METEKIIYLVTEFASRGEIFGTSNTAIHTLRESYFSSFFKIHAFNSMRKNHHLVRRISFRVLIFECIFRSSGSQWKNE